MAVLWKEERVEGGWREVGGRTGGRINTKSSQGMRQKSDKRGEKRNREAKKALINEGEDEGGERHTNEYGIERDG